MATPIAQVAQHEAPYCVGLLAPLLTRCQRMGEGAGDSHSSGLLWFGRTYEREDEMKYIVANADGSEIACPAVVFLASDILANAALEAYNDAVLLYHPSMEYRSAWFQLLRDWREWQRLQVGKVKVPD